MRTTMKCAAVFATLISVSASYAANVPVQLNKLINKATKLLKFLTKGNVTPVPLPLVGPTTLGGSLRECTDADPTGIVTPLPAANWKALGNPPGSKGYKYKDTTATTASGCKVMVLKPRVFKARCAPHATLPQPFTGSIRMRVKIGNNDYCGDCSTSGAGTVVKNDSSTLIMKDCPPPGSCLCASPSGAFLDAAAPF